jgi:guanylate kinase
VTAGARPLLVVRSGPSGVGKDAMLDELERRGHRFHRVVTCTTRPPRESERNGVEYHFVSDAEFDAMVEAGGLLEHAVVYGHQYGVPKSQVIEHLEAGEDVYVRTDVQGAAYINRILREAVLVFIAPGSLEELEGRIRGRGSDDEERVQRRLRTARGEMDRAAEFEHVIVNRPGELASAVDALEEILARERANAAAASEA